jgi:hypothetical protein
LNRADSPRLVSRDRQSAGFREEPKGEVLFESVAGDWVIEDLQLEHEVSREEHRQLQCRVCGFDWSDRNERFRGTSTTARV